MFHSMCWNGQTASLAALQYTNLIVWYDPLFLLHDQILVRKSLEKSDLRYPWYNITNYLQLRVQCSERRNNDI